jgi:putative ABC transport system ATP-binding protein
VSSGPVIELTDVGLQFAEEPRVEVLRGIDLRVEVGEFVAVVGPSGSGKSTLLNILGLLIAPTSGRYVLDGVDTHRARAKELAGLRASCLGFVFQGFHLLPHLSVRENTSMGGLYLGLPTGVRRARADRLLARVGLGHRIDATPATLSGGERQRAAIARALVAGPSLLLADEPTGNLDTASADSVLGLFTDLNRDGTTIVMITHDAQVAARATRTVRIVDGRIPR